MARILDIPILGTNRSIPLWVWAPLLLIALGISGYLVFRTNFSKYYWPKNWGVVDDHEIYRSGEIRQHLLEEYLAGYDIDVIVNLQGRVLTDPVQRAQMDICRKLGIRMERFPMRGNGIPGDDDHAAGVRKYARAVAAVVEARREGEVVLVQCNAGAHRTGGVVACYRMLVEGWPGWKAFEEMKAYRWDPERHSVLSEYINANLPTIAQHLVEMGAIDRIPEPFPFLGPKDQQISSSTPQRAPAH